MFPILQLLGRTLRVDHVEEYRKPKEHGDEDDLTMKVRAEGIAPRLPESIAPRLPESIAPRLLESLAPRLPASIAPGLPESSDEDRKESSSTKVKKGE